MTDTLHGSGSCGSAASRGGMVADAPSASGLPARRRCAECGSPFLAITHAQRFCSAAHKRAWHSRREAYGARLYQLCIEWRGKRRRGALSELTRLAGEIARDERVRAALAGLSAGEAE